MRWRQRNVFTLMKSVRIMSLRALLLGLSFGVFTPHLPCRADSTHGAELLSSANKSYKAGEYEQAYATLEEAFKAGLPNDLVARAILLRAEVNEKNGQLARALQDYSNALWMDTLPPAEKKIAHIGKERLMAALGLNTPGPASAPSSASVAGPPASPQGDGGGGLFGVFGGLFGSDGRQPTQPPAAAAEKTATAPAAPPAEKPAPKPRPSQTASAAASPKKPTAVQTAAAVQPASLNPHSSGSDGFLIVFGTTASEAAGKTQARQIKAKLADILINRELTLEPGDSGALQIVAGPYKAKNSAVALCNTIKQRGISCQVTP